MSGDGAEESERSKVASPLTTLNLQQFDPRNETPLFAAGLEFARETAGPITSAFLKALPAEWREGHLVIDSTLVWLGVGFRQGPMFWCHEPFPGRAEGAAGQSNNQRRAEHIACCCGPTGIEFLCGDQLLAECAGPARSMGEIRERHDLLQAGLAGGRVTKIRIPPDVMYRYGWGAFHQYEVAEVSGFQFWIRATRGDNRPLVNGIRNATNL